MLRETHCTTHRRERALAVLLAALLVPALPARAGLLAGWQYHAKVSLNTSSSGANVSENVANFPLLISLNDGNFSFKQALSSGQDLRFTDAAGTVLEQEVVEWNAGAQKAEVWVSIPLIKGQNDSQHIYMHWGNPGAPLPSDTTVFDSANGFVGVWHLEEDANGASENAIYSSSGQYPLTGIDHVASDGKNGTIGSGQLFDGSSDFIAVPHSPAMQITNALTISAWIKGSSYSNDRYEVNTIIRKGGRNPNNFNFAVNRGRIWLGLDENESSGLSGTTLLDTDVWYHVCATWDGASRRLFVNGKIDLTQPSSRSGTLSADTRDLYLGGRPEEDYFVGHLDEVRISKVARSPGWVRLSYENQRPDSKLLIFGEPESAPLEDLSEWTHARKILFNTTLTGVLLTSPVTPFPLLVRLHQENFDFSKAAPHGQDLRFADADGSPLPHRVESWDSAANKADVWVRVPLIRASSTTDYIRMHWGNPKAESRIDTGMVFATGDGFEGVWQMDPDFTDASLNERHAFNHGVELATGIAGSAGLFADTTYLDVGNWNLASKSGITLSAWIKPLSGGKSMPRIVSKANGSNTSDHLWMLGLNWDFGSTAKLFSRVHVGGSTQETNSLPLSFLNQWRLVSVTLENERIKIYVDGTEKERSYEPGLIGTDPNMKVWIGANPPNGYNGFRGLIDEVRVSHRATSADYHRLSYENQKPGSTFPVFGGLEQKPTFSQQPSDAEVMEGESVTFAISTEGSSPVSHQWYRNGSPIPGSSEPTLSIGVVTLSDNGSYYNCVVSNAYGSKSSREAFLTVVPIPPPAPDTAAAPGISPSDTVFHDSITVILATGTEKARIHFTLDGSHPDSSHTLYTGPITLFESTVIKAVSVKDGLFPSPPSTRVFNYSPSTPSASPPGGNFVDSLKVFLVPNREGDTLRYTLDGLVPSDSSALYSGAIWIRETSIVKVGAFHGGRQSPVATYQFSQTVQVSAPYALPAGGTYDDSIDIALNTSTPLAIIRYTLDGSEPGPTSTLYSQPLRLFGDTLVLKAIALKEGSPTSSIMQEAYSWNRKPPDSLLPGTTQELLPGQSLYLGQKYSVNHSGGSASPALSISFVALSPESTFGFDHVFGAMQFSSTKPEAQWPLPVIVSDLDAMHVLALFRQDDQGFHFVSPPSSTHSIPGPGKYILGLDTIAPILELVDQGIDVQTDSSWVQFRAMDNLASLTLNLDRSDSPASSWRNKSVTSGEPFRVSLKNAPGYLGSLRIRATVSDGSMHGSFPKDSLSYFSIAQKLKTAMSDITVSKANNWDLVSVPFDLPAGTTLASLLQTSSRQPSLPIEFGIAVWQPHPDRPDTGTYSMISAADPLPNNAALWVISSQPLGSLRFGSNLSTIASGNDGRFEVTLRRGWNQLRNPSLDTLYWPVRKTGTVSGLSSIKLPHPFDPVSQEFMPTCDTLPPWRGHFVYANSDTNIHLLPHPARLATGKAAAYNSSLAIDMRIALKGQKTYLWLGAAGFAHDSASREDEFLLPSPGNGMAIWSDRGRIKLGTDLIRFHPESLHVWRIGIGRSVDADPVHEVHLQLKSAHFPANFQLWAVHPERGIRKALKGDSLVWASHSKEQFRLMAGPPAALAKHPLFKMTQEGNRDFAATLLPGDGGHVLLAVFPLGGWVEAELWKLNGRRSVLLPRSYRAPGEYQLELLDQQQVLGRNGGSRLILKYTSPNGTQLRHWPWPSP